MTTIQLRVLVTDNHEVTIRLPDEIPPGLTDLTIRVEAIERPVVRMGGVLAAADFSALDDPESDPVSETLDELQAERARHLDALVAELEAE